MDGMQIISYSKSRNKVYTNYILELEEVFSVENSKDFFNDKVQNRIKDIIDDERFIFELESSNEKLSKPVMEIVYDIRKSYKNALSFYESFKNLNNL